MSNFLFLKQFFFFKHTAYFNSYCTSKLKNNYVVEYMKTEAFSIEMKDYYNATFVAW